MKRFTLLFFLVISQTLLFSQNSEQQALPNSLLADNSNTVVCFKAKYGNDRMSDELFNKLSSMVKKRLMSMGITVKTCFNVNEDDLENNVKKRNFSNQTLTAKCIIYFRYSNYKKETKDYAKDRLRLNNTNPYSVTLTDDKYNSYEIEKGESIDDYCNNLQTMVSSMPVDHFLKTIKRSDAEELQKKEENDRVLHVMDLQQKENEIEAFPPVAKLNKEELLVVCGYGVTEEDTKLVMDEHYGGKYKIMNQYDYRTYLNSKEISHKYVLLHKFRNQLDGALSNNGAGNNITLWYFVIKDLDNYSTYYSTDKQKLLNSAKKQQLKGLSYYLKAMKKHNEEASNK
jgi:hypothetical protein